MIIKATDQEATTRESPAGKFELSRKSVFNIADTGAPFDMDHVTLSPGKRNFPHHSHAALWEVYYVVSGNATVRMDDTSHEVSTGDTIVCPPGVAHQIINESDENVVYLVISNDPPFDSCYYPDSGKMLVSAKRVWKGHPNEDRAFWTETDETYYTGEE
jgi:uncharacterized cupin superfamily protein